MQDQVEIQGVLARYSDAINRRDWAALAVLFTDESSWRFTPGPNISFPGEGFTGNGAQIAAGIRGVVEATDMLFQLHSPAHIEVRGDHATVRSSMGEVAEIAVQNRRIETRGMYEDKLFRSAGHWRFASRLFTIFNIRFTQISD